MGDSVREEGALDKRAREGESDEFLGNPYAFAYRCRQEAEHERAKRKWTRRVIAGLAAVGAGAVGYHLHRNGIGPIEQYKPLAEMGLFGLVTVAVAKLMNACHSRKKQELPSYAQEIKYHAQELVHNGSALIAERLQHAPKLNLRVAAGTLALSALLCAMHSSTDTHYAQPHKAAEFVQDARQYGLTLTDMIKLPWVNK